MFERYGSLAGITTRVKLADSERVPLVEVTTIVLVPNGVTGVGNGLALLPQPFMADTINTSTKSEASLRLRHVRETIRQPMSPANKTFGRTCRKLAVMPEPAVVTDTMPLPPVTTVPLNTGVKVAGVTLHAAFAGSPEQLKVTVVVSPPTVLNVIGTTATWPCLTVIEVNPSVTGTSGFCTTRVVPADVTAA